MGGNKNGMDGSKHGGGAASSAGGSKVAKGGQRGQSQREFHMDDAALQARICQQRDLSPKRTLSTAHSLSLKTFSFQHSCVSQQM